MKTTTGDGMIDVPGAQLRYRLVGQASELPLLVFENGWGASFEQWAWVERELASQTRLLFYDRAGIGGSNLLAPQTVGGLSNGLASLLSSLKITTPVVVVGHSYGGLMGGLHLAQQPQLLRALIQIDATPDRADAAIDAQLGVMRVAGPISVWLARLHIGNPLFAPAGKMLPAPAGDQLMRRSFANVSSLQASVAEMKMLDAIRAAIAAQPAPRPALIISAGRASEPKGPMARIVSPEKARALAARMQALHQQKAAECTPGIWESLPYDHGALVFTQEGAKATAARILAYVQSLA